MTQVQVWDAVYDLFQQTGKTLNMTFNSPSKPGTQRRGEWTWDITTYGNSGTVVKIIYWEDGWLGPEEIIRLPYPVMFQNEEEKSLCLGDIRMAVERAKKRFK